MLIPGRPTILFDRELLQDREYWRAQLADPDCAVAIPPDFPRASEGDGGLATIPFVLEAARSEALLRLARENDLLLYATISACSKLLLHLFSEATRIAIGSPARGDGAEANLLPIISRITPEMAVSELLTAELAALREAYRHQRWPYSRMLEDLGFQSPSSGASRIKSPLFAVVIELSNLHDPLPLPDPGNDITLTLTRDGRQLSGRLSYRAALYARRTMERFGELLGRTIAWAVADPGRKLADCSLITAVEQGVILNELNNTKAPFPDSTTFHALFEEQAARTPAATALLTREQAISYGQLNQGANRLARYLGRRGVGRGRIVGICFSRIPEGITAILAVLKAGGSFLPLDPEYPRERLAFMVADAGVELVLSHGEQAGELAGLNRAEVVLIDEIAVEVAQLAADNLPLEGSPDDCAYLIYTSGSTGTPKGALNTHRGLCNLAVAQARAFGLTPQSRVLQFASWSFDAMVSELAMTFSTGATLALCPAESIIPGPPLTEVINELGISHVTLPPAALHYLEPADLPSLSHLVTAGDFCPEEQSRRWAAAKVFFNAYGVSEAAVCSTIAPLSLDETVGGVGRPMSNTRVYILDRKGQMVPVGVPGELYLAGVGVGPGYLNRPELSATRFLADPFAADPAARMYRSGDRGRLLDDGSVELIGRIDQQIKLRGFRIEPGEIEHVLEQHPAVAKAVVMLSETGDSLLAFIEAPGNSPSSSELAGHCGGLLPPFMIPAAWTVLKAFPLNANGKIDRKALLLLGHQRRGQERNLSAPRNLTELKLVAIWQEILNVEAVGIRENFFELGGHSLLAIRLLALVQQRLGVKFSLGKLIENPTIEQLAASLHDSAQGGTGVWSHLVTLRAAGMKKEERLPLFCFHPGGGHVQGYLELSRRLGDDQPIYGLQAAGFEEGQEVIDDLETMAARYLAAIREVRPRGPYAIVGWCFGARIAFECAQKLVAAGEQVAYLALLDAYAPQVIPAALLDNDDATLWESLLAQDVAVSADQLRQYRPEEQLTRVIQLAKEADLIPDYYSEEQARRVMEVFRANSRMVQTPVTGIYPGPVELFKAEEEAATARLFTPEPDLGWRELVEGELTITTVPGNHNTLVREPHVRVLAEALKRSLQALPKEL